MQLPQIMEVRGFRVLTTRQLAEAYGTEIKVIQNNFQRNKDRYTAGKHYIYMDRDELREVKTTCPQFEGELKRASRMHFWTEKGALLHAKSLNTDKAWEVYDYLVDFYFRAKEKQSESVKRGIVPVTYMNESSKSARVHMVVDIPNNPSAQKAIEEVKKALAAVDIMLDESNRYISKEAYDRYKGDIMDAFQALMVRVTKYLNIVPGVIEKSK